VSTEPIQGTLTAGIVIKAKLQVKRHFRRIIEIEGADLLRY
jgi:hypothetical protein